ncbi:MAG: hypothetical protein ABI551_06540 [Polyangiaceae bacterium]
MKALPLRVSLVLAALGTSVGCSKHVPADVAPLVDSIKPDARAVAVEAAKACGDVLKSGRMTVTAKGCSLNVLPGETMVPELPSPAKGTALEANPNVANVFVMCNAAVAPNLSCGSGLGALRRSPGYLPADTGPRDPADSTCKGSPTDCDEVLVPSRYFSTPGSADLRVVRPVIGGPAGATAEVTVVLKKK